MPNTTYFFHILLIFVDFIIIAFVLLVIRDTPKLSRKILKVKVRGVTYKKNMISSM